MWSSALDTFARTVLNGVLITVTELVLFITVLQKKILIFHLLKYSPIQINQSWNRKFFICFTAILRYLATSLRHFDVSNGCWGLFCACGLYSDVIFHFIFLGSLPQMRQCSQASDSELISSAVKWWLLASSSNPMHSAHPVNKKTKELGDYHHFFLELMKN